MPSYIFVELEGILATPKNGEVGTLEAIKKYHPREEIISDINHLAEKHDIVVFSVTKEEERQAIEDFLLENNIQTDKVLLRDEYNRSALHIARQKMILDFFDGNDNKMFLETHTVYTNNDKFTDLLRDEEYTVYQVG